MVSSSTENRLNELMFMKEALEFDLGWFLKVRDPDNQALQNEIAGFYEPSLYDAQQLLLKPHGDPRTAKENELEDQVHNLLVDLSQQVSQLKNTSFPAQIAPKTSKQQSVMLFNTLETIADSHISDPALNGALLKFLKYAENVNTPDFNTENIPLARRIFNHDLFFTKLFLEGHISPDTYLRFAEKNDVVRSTPTQKELAIAMCAIAVAVSVLLIGVLFASGLGGAVIAAMGGFLFANFFMSLNSVFFLVAVPSFIAAVALSREDICGLNKEEVAIHHQVKSLKEKADTEEKSNKIGFFSQPKSEEDEPPPYTEHHQTRRTQSSYV